MRAQVDQAGARVLKTGPLGPYMFWKISPSAGLGVQRMVLRSVTSALTWSGAPAPRDRALGARVGRYLPRACLRHRLDANDLGLEWTARDPPRQPVQGRGVWRCLRNQLSGVSCRTEELVVKSPDSPGHGRRRRDGEGIRPGRVRGRGRDRYCRTARFRVALSSRPRHIPADSSSPSFPLTATCSGQPWTRTPLRLSAPVEGRWLIPLGEQGPCRVSLFWSAQGFCRGIKWFGLVTGPAQPEWDGSPRS